MSRNKNPTIIDYDESTPPLRLGSVRSNKQVFTLTWAGGGPAQTLTGYTAVCLYIKWSMPTLRARLAQGKGRATRTMENPHTGVQDTLEVVRQRDKEPAGPRTVLARQYMLPEQRQFLITMPNGQPKLITGEQTIARLLNLAWSSLRVMFYQAPDQTLSRVWRGQPVTIKRLPISKPDKVTHVGKVGRPPRKQAEEPEP